MEPSHPSRSPLLFKNTAVKVEEDVLVMDGVVVKNPPVDRGRSLTDSGGSPSSLSPGGKNYKLDMCLSYLENSGYCRYGTEQNASLHMETRSYVHHNIIIRPHKRPFCKSYNIIATSSTPPATSTTQTESPIKVDELELTRNFC